MKNKEPKKKCPECGSTKLSVYLVADYNSSVDAINTATMDNEGICRDGVGLSWAYSDAIHETFCDISVSYTHLTLPTTPYV